MKRILTAVTLLLCYATVGVAQVAPPAGPPQERRYTKSFRGQDLTGKKFLKENLDNCDFEDANLASVDFSGSTLRNCNFRGAILKNAIFAYADASGSDFRESEFTQVSVFRATLNQVNFEGLDLSTIQLHDLKLRGASFRNVKDVWTIYGADFYEADLRGANFSKAAETPPASFRKAKYDQFTRWHENFDPKSRGLVYEESKLDAVAPPAVPPASPTGIPARNSASEFDRLDGNEDGILSGKEAAAHLSKDLDGDGEISRAEFTAVKR